MPHPHSTEASLLRLFISIAIGNTYIFRCTTHPALSSWAKLSLLCAKRYHHSGGFYMKYKQQSLWGDPEALGTQFLKESSKL